MKSRLHRAARLYVVLLHYPVLNKEGKVVATAIANMDIHDLARTAKTYGVAKLFVANPNLAQRELAGQIIDHWRSGYGATYNPSRKEAFEIVAIRSNLAQVVKEIEEENQNAPKIIVTGANFRGNVLSYGKLKKILNSNYLPYLLIFGTGSGVTQDVISQADYQLESIRGTGNYNHLSVRSAVAIVLDRITNRF